MPGPTSAAATATTPAAATAASPLTIPSRWRGARASSTARMRRCASPVRNGCSSQRYEAAASATVSPIWKASSSGSGHCTSMPGLVSAITGQCQR